MQQQQRHPYRDDAASVHHAEPPQRDQHASGGGGSAASGQAGGRNNGFPVTSAPPARSLRRDGQADGIANTASRAALPLRPTTAGRGSKNTTRPLAAGQKHRPTTAGVAGRSLFSGTVPSDPRAFADPLCSIFSHADRDNGGFGYWPVGWWCYHLTDDAGERPVIVPHRPNKRPAKSS